ncbi:SIR2 family protein [Rhizobium sp. ZW T2_16]|uniref:SIR2 family protein n=1 Tax=Rhizobium sp. ZW T2_16 TaxID=3378083 RepID=UPI003851CF6A
MGELASHLLTEFKTSRISADAMALWDQHSAAIADDFESGLNQIPIGAGARSELTEEVRRLISGVICDRTLSAEDDIRASGSPDQAAPARLLRLLFNGIPQNSECAPVITTNYDTLIELFCDLARLPIDTGFEGHRYRHFRRDAVYRTHFRPENVAGKKAIQIEYRKVPNVRVMKPHGSITWHSTTSGPVEILDYRKASSRAIVIPGPTKYEEALIERLFDSVRAEMNNVLRDASGLMCIGFGFNDAHLQGVITERLGNRMPMLILTRTFTLKIEALLKDYPHVIAIARDGDGAQCHVDGEIHQIDDPAWELDSFLKLFLE